MCVNFRQRLFRLICITKSHNSRLLRGVVRVYISYKVKTNSIWCRHSSGNGPAAIFVITSICSGHIRVLLKCSTALWLAAVKRFIKALITRYATSSELHFPVDKPPFLLLLPFARWCCRKRLRTPPQVWCLWQVNKLSLSWAFKAINSQ